MKEYIVGGYVRDTIMGKSPKDRDFVVVGSSHEEMISLGFKIVGNDFPVYISPENGEEYALVRIERKTGQGYNGFSFETENVSLEQDLGRRDLTINSMAMDRDGNIIDPYNGQRDIKECILRHVNADAFREDPVRVLRIARFLARWPDFSVAKETKELCKKIVLAGEMEHLTAERISMEMIKAFSEKQPSRFFYFLRMVGALKVVFPEIDALIGVEQPYEHHPEGDAFIHTMMVIDACCEYGSDPLAVFCSLVHDLGKAVTPKEKWPHHYGHEEAGVPIVISMGERLKLSNEYINHGALVARYHMHIHKLHELKSKTIVRMFDDLKTKSNIHIIDILPWVSCCDSHGRTSFHSHKPYPNFSLAKEIFVGLHHIKLSHFKTPDEIKQMSVNQIKEFLYKQKLHFVSETKKNYIDK